MRSIITMKFKCIMLGITRYHPVVYGCFIFIPLNSSRILKHFPYSICQDLTHAKRQEPNSIVTPNRIQEALFH
jgi:hypothetical protein